MLCIRSIIYYFRGDILLNEVQIVQEEGELFAVHHAEGLLKQLLHR